MTNRMDDSGQVLLTSAIMFALVIIVIALMLNNIIYATNVAYIGFMDGSKYEDFSIRQMTTNEAAGAYQRYHDIATVRNQYMSDYLKALNYLTNSKGKYVDLTDTYYTSPHLGLTVTQTQWNLVITNKNSVANYTVQTGSPNPAAPHPPSSVPMPAASLDNGTYDIIEGGAFTVTIKLSGSYDQPVVVNYKTTELAPGPNAATVTVDYVNIPSGSVTFYPGQLSKTVTVSTQQDTGYEMTESFLIELSGYNNAVPGTFVTATVNIVDDDTAPAPTPAPQNYAMKVNCTAVRETGGDKKDITIKVYVENTGLNTLHNIQFTLVSPTGKTVLTPFNTIGTLNAGSTANSTCVIRTQNQNDLVSVIVQAKASEIPAGVSSQQLTNV